MRQVRTQWRRGSEATGPGKLDAHGVECGLIVDQAIAATVVRALPDVFCDFNELARLGVKWVLANPEPEQLEKPAYRR